MIFDLKEWYLQKQVGEIIIKFMGDISPDTISRTLESIENYFADSGNKNTLLKKIYNVTVECFQNLYHHGDQAPVEFVNDDSTRFGALLIVKDGSFYRISTGNFIKTEKYNLLKDRIEQLNSLTDVELKTLYRDILSNDEYSTKGGGGLGMLDIVRKTGNKLEYNFYPAGSGYMYFTMDVYIS